MSASLVVLSYVLPDGTGDTIYLDASVNEQHIVTAQVTEHQVEKGSQITDHIRPMPRKVTIEAVVTNTPISSPRSQGSGSQGTEQPFEVTVGYRKVSGKALAFSVEFDRVRAVYGGLVDAALAGALFTVYTSLTPIQGGATAYENMALINFAVPRNVESGNAIRCTMDFQQLRIVETQTVDLAKPTSTAKKKRGQKSGKEIDKESKEAEKPVDVLTRLGL